MSGSIHPGDFTGREVQRLKQLNAEQIADRQQQLGLVSGGVTQEFDDCAVYDPQSGQRLKMTEEEARALDAATRQFLGDFEDDAEVLEVDFGGDFAVIRPVQDVEGMTYGIGVTLSFYRGRKYRVSKEIGEHLVSKGLAERVSR
jgi:hypothetical protein